MDSGTIVTDIGLSTYGPATYQAKIGNPSPATTGQTQLVDSTKTSWIQSFEDAATASVKAAIGLSPSNTAAKATVGATQAIGSGVAAAGQGILKVATSAATGVEYAVFAVVLLVILFIAAPYVGLLRRN